MIRDSAKTILNVLLPPSCLSCKREGLFLCPDCRTAIEEYRYFICPVCKRRDVEGRLDPECRKLSELTRFLGAPLPYPHETVRAMIHAFKYRHAKDLAKPLARILIEFLERNYFGEFLPKNRKKMLLVPVPLTNFRERERGFNQAAEIARYVASYYSLPLQDRILRKPKHTSSQIDAKTKDERATNIAGAFTCPHAEAVARKIVILVDDVYTSGATMRECASALRSAGARQVWGLTVARG